MQLKIGPQVVEYELHRFLVEQGKEYWEDAIDAAYPLLVKHQIDLAMHRTTGTNLFKGLNFIPPDIKEIIVKAKGGDKEERHAPVVDTSKLDTTDLWAWSRLTEPQRTYFDNHIQFHDWVLAGCKNTFFPMDVRTPRHEFK